MTKSERLQPIGEARDHVERAIEAMERHGFIEENKNMANELRLVWLPRGSHAKRAVVAMEMRE